MSLEEEGHQEPFDVVGAADDFLVAALRVGADGGQFEAVERALSGQGLAAVAAPLPGRSGGIVLADNGGEQWVATQVVVVVEILVPQCQAVDPLGDQLRDGMLDEVGVAMVGEAGGELMDDRREFFGLAEQQGAAVGGDVAAVEVGEHLAGAEHGKIEVG